MLEVEGCLMCSSFAGHAELWAKSFAKVKVELNDTSTSVDISLMVSYGCKIPDVAWEVQERVKKSIESMTGLEVEKVNIYVDGLVMPKEEKTAQSEEDEK